MEKSAVGRKNRHPDFVIIDPENGLLFLEVKDWTVSTLRQANQEQVTLETDGSGQWRQVRLPLPESQRRQVSGQTMLGELWFQNNPAWLGKKSVPPLKLEIADIALE